MKLIFRIRMIHATSKKKSFDQSDEICILKDFQDALLNNIVLRGANKIKNVLTRKLQNVVSLNDGKYSKKETWVLDTVGTNMLEALALDFIDTRKTLTTPFHIHFSSRNNRTIGSSSSSSSST